MTSGLRIGPGNKSEVESFIIYAIIRREPYVEFQCIDPFARITVHHTRKIPILGGSSTTLLFLLRTGTFIVHKCEAVTSAVVALFDVKPTNKNRKICERSFSLNFDTNLTVSQKKQTNKKKQQQTNKQ